MITVYFPKYIRKLTNGRDKQDFDTDCIQTVVEGLRFLFPDLSLYISNINSIQIHNILYFIDKNTKDIIKSTLSTKVKSTELVLLMTIYGGGDDFGSIAIGAALIAASFIPGVGQIAAFGVSLSGFLISSGISLVLSGVLSALSPKAVAASREPPDAPIRNNNDSFGPLQNTTSTDMAIPLIYGYHRVGGQFVGGKIKTINHDKDTIISVANYI